MFSRCRSTYELVCIISASVCNRKPNVEAAWAWLLWLKRTFRVHDRGTRTNYIRLLQLIQLTLDPYRHTCIRMSSSTRSKLLRYAFPPVWTLSLSFKYPHAHVWELCGFKGPWIKDIILYIYIYTHTHTNTYYRAPWTRHPLLPPILHAWTHM